MAVSFVDMMNALLLVGVVFTTPGCAGRPPTSQDTPQATLRKYHHALVTGDREAFIECHGPTVEEYERLAGRLFDALRSAYEVREQFDKRYGAASWEDFTFQFARGTFWVQPPPKETEWVTAHRFKRRNGRVLFSHPTTLGPTEVMVMSEGAWYINLAEYISDATAWAGMLSTADQANKDAVKTMKSNPDLSTAELAERYSKWFAKDQ